MDRKDLKRLGTLLMFVALVASAPSWLNPANQRPSAYDAPWVYPSLIPGTH